MSTKKATIAAPPRWTDEELERDLQEATAFFRKQRMEEPLEAYLNAFDQYRGVVEDLLETTVDLSDLYKHAKDILTDGDLLSAFRYLSGPPISLDDLKTLVEGNISTATVKSDPKLVKRIVETILAGIDQRRFPWVAQNREPTEAEREAAVLASAALMATQRLSTDRRNEGKEEQERMVRQTLLDHGFQEVARRTIVTLGDAPLRGQFCMESMLGTRKADLILGLHDGRTMAIECKVSNSSTNSIKRLNNDAAAKAEDWSHQFGTSQVVPAAVLSGVYKLKNIQNAQVRNLTIFWSHRLKDLTDFIDNTK